MEPQQSRTFELIPAPMLPVCPHAGCGQIANAVHELRQPASSLALLLAILERKAQDPALSPTLRAAQGAVERLGLLLPALPLACAGHNLSGSLRPAHGYPSSELGWPSVAEPGALGEQAELWPALAPGFVPSPVAEARVATAANHLTLIVEDHADVADALAAVIADSGHQVRIAADADAAMAALASGARFSAVISDLGLPGGRSGLEVLAFAGQLMPRATLVLISGDCSPDLVARARERGARLLHKPLLAADLLAALAP